MAAWVDLGTYRNPQRDAAQTIGLDWVEFWEKLHGLDWFGSDDRYNCYIVLFPELEERWPMQDRNFLRRKESPLKSSGRDSKLDWSNKL